VIPQRVFSDIVSLFGFQKWYLGYIWYQSKRVRITVTHRDFIEVATCSFCNYRDFGTLP
jgi:hypothetical protein